MNEFEITSENTLSLDDRRFIPLTPLKPAGLMPLAEDKLRKITLKPLREIWATLGFADDSEVLQLSGRIQFSNYGNLRSKGVTAEEIELLRSANPFLSDNDVIIERFVNLSELDLSGVDQAKYSEDNPMLRLTVMVDQSEGALAFFHHQSRSGRREAVEYLQPDKTEGHNLHQRDRLDYRFNLPDTFFPEKGEEGEKTRLIKVLIFPRNRVYADSNEAIRELGENLGKKPYCLQWYDPLQNHFVKVKDPGALEYDQKTLLLLHGTFSTTLRTFSGLLEDYGRAHTSWLYQLTTLGGGPYDQIIGFDHRTVLDDVQDNEARLLELLDGKKFTQDIDVITGSRGGLLAKQLASSAAVQERAFRIRRGVLAACSNGVKYYSLGRTVSRYLSMLRMIAQRSGLKLAGLIAGFAQHSIDVFLNQPGNIIQTPGSDPLTELLSRPRVPGTVLMPVVGDYIPLKTDKKLLGRIGDLVVDSAVSGLYGTFDHDWVVESENQRIMDPCQMATPFNNYDPATDSFNSIHTRYFKTGDVKDLIYKFLEEESSVNGDVDELIVAP